MTDAPARIWATVNGARTRYEIGAGPVSSGAFVHYVIGGWQGIPDDSPRATKYVRADIVEAMRSALADALMALADRRAADAKGYTERASKSVDAALSRLSKEQADG